MSKTTSQVATEKSPPSGATTYSAKAYAAGGRAHPVMGAVAAKMSDAEMKAVSEFIAGLR